MKGWGIALTGIGVGIALASLAMDTTITTDPVVSSNPYMPSMPSGVYNMGLIQHQLMVFLFGLALAVAGVAMASAGAVIAELRRSDEPIKTDSAAGSEPVVETKDGIARVADSGTDNTFLWAAGSIGVMAVVVAIVAAMQPSSSTTTQADRAIETNVAEEMALTDNTGMVPPPAANGE